MDARDDNSDENILQDSSQRRQKVRRNAHLERLAGRADGDVANVLSIIVIAHLQWSRYYLFGQSEYRCKKNNNFPRSNMCLTQYNVRNDKLDAEQKRNSITSLAPTESHTLCVYPPSGAEEARDIRSACLLFSATYASHRPS